MEKIFGKASERVGKASARQGGKKKQGGVGGEGQKKSREGRVGDDVIKKNKK